MAAACLANLKQIDLASIMYENDYDDHGPGRLWSTQIKPYLKELHETDKVLHDLSPVGIKFGYAMNRKVVNLDSASVKEPNQLITFFDSTADAPHAVADLGTLPFPGRHKGRNNVAYADGHVKRLLSARSK